MSADVVVPSILTFINDNVYPDNEGVASSNLTSKSLEPLLNALRQEQNAVQTEIRSLSRDTASDIDSWISRAKELQEDILRSREIARQIVTDAENGDRLKAAIEDKARKHALLEKEVEFNESLTGTLEHIQYANALLDRAQEQATVADIKHCFITLENAESSIGALNGIAGTTVVAALQHRASQLRDSMKETIEEFWNGMILVNVEENWIRIPQAGVGAYVEGSQLPVITLETIVEAAESLGLFETLLQKLAKDIERTILKPRMNVNNDQLLAKVSIDQDQLTCSNITAETDSSSLFQDLHRIVDFLSKRLPAEIGLGLSAQLMPALNYRLERYWLDPAMPVSMQDISDFQALLSKVSSFSKHLEDLGWSGSEALSRWTEDAPRAWLTKRREIVLGDVRNLVFEGLRERKTVERVETRVVSQKDMGLSSSQITAPVKNEEEDDWDTAWDETEDKAAHPSTAVEATQECMTEDDDESSAWDMDDQNPDEQIEDNNAPDESEAWGWDDEDTKTPSQAASSNPNQQEKARRPVTNGDIPQEQELTLRETFMVTAIPEGILAIMQQTVSDAQSLAGPEYSETPLAPVATALYTIPTLALAIFRATAPTAYAKVDGLGNMLIYNDSSRLGEQLRKWQAEQPARSKLRVDNDVAALESFAKRAYATEMDSQRTILKDLLDGAQSFTNCTQPPFKQECEGAVEAAIDRLRDVHRMWKDVLSQGALLQSLGSLLGTLTGKMISEIEDLGDIGEEDSRQLKALCDTVLSANDLFTQHNNEEAQDMTFIYCPTWLKFQYLAEILESSLADIKWMWKEGELSLEFGAEEVVELVEALFAESDLRRAAVREIRRGR